MNNNWRQSSELPRRLWHPYGRPSPIQTTPEQHHIHTKCQVHDTQSQVFLSYDTHETL